MRPPMRGGRGGGRDFRGGGGGGRFGGGGGRFGGRGGYDQGPPDSVVEAGHFAHACEGEAVVKLTNPKIPYFNAPIFLENKTQIGKVEEILGPINSVYFTIKMSDGVVATSYASGQKFYIDPMKLLPLERFLPPSQRGPWQHSWQGGWQGGRPGRQGRLPGGCPGWVWRAGRVRRQRWRAGRVWAGRVWGQPGPQPWRLPGQGQGLRGSGAQCLRSG
ncbi:Gar1/Naf1 RNA binding region-domain-containing protein [Haematococcus lacustris]